MENLAIVLDTNSSRTILARVETTISLNQVDTVEDAWPMDLVIIDEVGRIELYYEYDLDFVKVIKIDDQTVYYETGKIPIWLVVLPDEDAFPTPGMNLLVYSRNNQDPIAAIPSIELPPQPLKLKDERLDRVHIGELGKTFGQFCSVKTVGSKWDAVILGILEGLLRKNIGCIMFEQFIDTLEGLSRQKLSKKLKKMNEIKKLKRNTAISQCSKYLEDIEFINELGKSISTFLMGFSEHFPIQIRINDVNTGEVEVIGRLGMFTVNLLFQKFYSILYSKTDNILDHYIDSEYRFSDTIMFEQGKRFVQIIKSLTPLLDDIVTLHDIRANMLWENVPCLKMIYNQLNALLPDLVLCDNCLVESTKLKLHCGHSICLSCEEIFGLSCPICKQELSRENTLALLSEMKIQKHINESMLYMIKSRLFLAKCVRCTMTVNNEFFNIGCRHLFCLDCFAAFIHSFHIKRLPAFCPICDTVIDSRISHLVIGNSRCYNDQCPYSVCHENTMKVKPKTCFHCEKPMHQTNLQPCGCSLCEPCRTEAIVENHSICFECGISWKDEHPAPYRATDCRICYEEFKNPFSLTCGHSFCFECLVEHCLVSISESRVRVRCPDCSTGIQQACLQVLLPAYAFEQLSTLQILHSGPLVPCPFCGTSCEPISKNSTCPLCNFTFCTRCFEGAHRGRCTYLVDPTLFDSSSTTCPWCCTVGTHDNMGGCVTCPTLSCKTKYCAYCQAPWLPIILHGPLYHRKPCKFWLEQPLRSDPTCPFCFVQGQQCTPPYELLKPGRLLPGEY